MDSMEVIMSSKELELQNKKVEQLGILIEVSKNMSKKLDKVIELLDLIQDYTGSVADKR